MPLGHLLGACGRLFGVPESLFGSLWAALGRLLVPLSDSGRLFGVPGSRFGSLWVALGRLLVHLVPLGRLFGVPESLFGSPSPQIRSV